MQTTALLLWTTLQVVVGVIMGTFGAACPRLLQPLGPAAGARS